MRKKERINQRRGMPKSSSREQGAVKLNFGHRKMIIGFWKVLIAGTDRAVPPPISATVSFGLRSAAIHFSYPQ
uniref:Uncharacterized protein n=1 Tax=Parascaris univalens TaxID=6257 RepID=A0A914ZX55_PARUN